MDLKASLRGFWQKIAKLAILDTILLKRNDKGNDVQTCFALKDFRKSHWSKPQKCNKCLAANVISPVQVLTHEISQQGSVFQRVRGPLFGERQTWQNDMKWYCKSMQIYIKHSRVRIFCSIISSETCILRHELNDSSSQVDNLVFCPQHGLTRLATNRMVKSLWQSSHGDEI